MRSILMRQFTIACLALGLAVFLGSIAVSVAYWSGSTTAIAAPVGTAIMIVTLALQLAFVLLQTIPEGRHLVSVRYFGPDVWLSIISFTLMPGVAWHALGTIAAPFMRGIMPGYMTPVVTAALLMTGRIIQQRNYRHLVNGSAPPVA